LLASGRQTGWPVSLAAAVDAFAAAACGIRDRMLVTSLVMPASVSLPSPALNALFCAAMAQK
jgi:hypothetical protein